MAASNNILEFLQSKAREKRMPFTVNFELLPVCNLDCKMCYIRTDWKSVNNNGGLISYDRWIELAKELREIGTFAILLTGGEVFLYPKFKELYIELYKMGFSLTINTNGTMINESTVEWLKMYPPRCVSISLYGSNDDVYEKLCGQKNMFERLDKAIRFLKENQINVECKTILTPLNYDDLENCWEYVNRLQIPYEAVAYSFPALRKIENKDQVRFNPKEVVACTFHRNKIMSTPEQYKENIEKYLQKYEDSKHIPGKDSYGFTCSACNTSCWITWQGNMTPCGVMDKPYTKPFEQGFSNAWEELKQTTDKILLSRKCSHCDKRQICTVCPASAYAETGDFGGTSQYHCEMTEYFLEEMNRFKQEW